MGKPALTVFAPYAAHCLAIELFFQIAVAKGLISPDRASNRTDIVYLYYLPFAQLFISSDTLHRETAPLFLTEGQEFVWGPELKADLKALNLYFCSVQTQAADGLFEAPHRPPDDDSFLTSRLWHSHLGPQAFSAKVDTGTVSPNLGKELMDQMRDMEERLANSPTDVFTREELSDPDRVAIQRAVPIKRGRWRFVSEEIARKSRGA